MHIWSALLTREAAYGAVLFLIGCGPASLLAPRLDTGSQLALTPLLGFCLGTCVTTTILEFAPVKDTYWILIPLALVSGAVGAVRGFRGRGARDPAKRLRPSDIVALALVAIVVVVPTDAVLRSHHTTGPGVYTYTDVDNYVAVQDAAQTVSLRAARKAWRTHARGARRFANEQQFTWAYFAQSGSNLDATPLDANVNALLGLGATDTFAAFLTILMLGCGLAVFAAVRYFAGRPTWFAIVGGSLCGGPLFLELWFDSYQAAMCALGLTVVFVVVASELLATMSRRHGVLVAVVLATMMSVYPLYLALLMGTSALVLLWWIFIEKGMRRISLAAVRRPALAVLALGLLTIALDPIALLRDVHYFRLLLRGQIDLPRVSYALHPYVIPGWIAQTREFWALSDISQAPLKQALLAFVLPLGFVALIVVGVMRYRRASVLLALGLVAVLLALNAYFSQQSCTYCAERNLIALGPAAAILVSLGLCALFAQDGRLGKVVSIGALVILAAAVGQRTRIELRRFSQASYFLDSANRVVLNRLGRSGSVLEEGYGGSVFAQAEQPLVYHLLSERAPTRTSIILGTNLGNALAYLDFGAPYPPGPEFDPRYRYVLTRLAGVATARRVVARRGGIALEERVQPLDIVPYAGFAVPFERISGAGIAWVQTQYPLQMYIVGFDGGRPAWARLTFAIQNPVTVPPQRGVRSRQTPHLLTVCVRATGSEPVRGVTLRMEAILHPGPIPRENFPPPMPLEGVALTSMQAVTRPCVP